MRAKHILNVDPEELLPSDQQILDALADGRCTPAFLVEITGLSKPTIHSRLNVLVAAGHVEKIHTSGLYELVDDPRKE
jgi:DNA-binding IclR family transcriptional regulator